MKPIRIVAKGGSEWFLSTSRYDLRFTYRKLRNMGISPFDARSIITDIVLSAKVAHR